MPTDPHSAVPPTVDFVPGDLPAPQKLPDAEPEQPLLAVTGEFTRAQWLAFLRSEQQKCWKRGERVLVETYLAQQPALGTEPRAILELVSAEIGLRQQQGEQPLLEEYQRRFPQFSAQMAELLGLPQSAAAGVASAGTAPRDAQGGAPAAPMPPATARLDPHNADSGEFLVPWETGARSDPPQGLDSGAPGSARPQESARWLAPTERSDSLPPGPAGRAGEATVASQAAPPAGPPSTLMDSGGSPPAAKPVEPRSRTYEIVKELGRGGMGVVYLIRQPGLQRMAALKMLLSGGHAGQNDLARFHTEAEAFARLQHPNIVQVYESGERDGCPYMVLEYISGGSLIRMLHEESLAPGAMAELTGTMARAIHYAHQRGVIHRDLKPGNVLLTEEGVPKITDFGLAKLVEGEHHSETRTGAVMGTPGYMAPEQAAGQIREISSATDVYALGAMLYEMLTGRPPFKAESIFDVLQQVIHQEPVPPSQMGRKVPRDLETICLKCLEKAPARRYGTALDLAEDLGRFQRGEPIHARPIGRWERGWKWARRRPAVAALVTVCAAAVVGLVGLYVWHNADLGIQLEHARTEWAREEANARVLAERARVAEENDRLSTLRAQQQQLLLEGEAALAARNWQQAQLLVAKVQGTLNTEPKLADLKEVADRVLAQVRAQEEDEAAQRKARTNYETFVKRRDDALYHGTLFTGVDLAASLQEAKAAAWEALDCFGVTIEDEKGPVVEELFYSPRERADIATGCYELLLLLAEVMAQPLPESKPEEVRQQATQALQILRRAGQVGPRTRAYYLRRARYLAQLGNEARAKGELELAEFLKPTVPLDYFVVGDDRYKQGRLEEAVTYFDNALRLEPDHFWSQYFLAVCYLKLSRPAEAKASLTALLNRRPDFIWIYLLRGYAHGQLGAFEAAEADFHKALALDPNAHARYGIHVNRGAMRLEQGKLDEAVTDLQQAITLMPKQYQAYANLADAYTKQQKLEAAAAPLDQAIRLAPTVAALYRQRGQLALARGHLPAALEDFERAIPLERPGDRKALALDQAERGRILHRTRRYQEAVAAYDAALQHDPDYSVAHRLRAEALLELRRPADAIASFSHYLEKGEPVADVYRARGLARATVGDYAGAVQDYTRALELEPDSSNMRTRRGWAYILESQKLALRDFEEAVRLNPENADAYNGRGYAQVRLGHLPEAVADAEEALRKGAQSVEICYNAACIYAEAVGKVRADARQPDRESRARKYEGRALELVQQSLALLPPAQREAFWHAAIAGDPALDAIRPSAGFVKLAATYSQGKKPPDR